MTKRRVNVRAVIWRDGKILAVKQRNRENVVAGYWSTPGGGLDPMESLEEGVQREIIEELGVKTEVGNLLAIQQLSSGRDDCDEELELFFHLHDSPLFDEIDLTKTTHGVAEIADVAFVDPRDVYILPTFLSEIDIEARIAGTAPVYIANEL